MDSAPLVYNDRTYCDDSDCPMKSECQRFYSGNAIHWRFVNSPRKDDMCDLFWGKTQDSIFSTLEEVMVK